MTKEKQIAQLRLRIKEELEDCNDTLWPTLCKLKSSKEGFAKIERMVIQYVAREAMPIGSALALLEQEFQHIDQAYEK